MTTKNSSSSGVDQAELSAPEGRAGEVTPALWRYTDHVWISDTGTKSCEDAEVDFGTPRCKRCQSPGCLPRNAADRECNKPMRKNFVAVKKKKKELKI